jgi:hypothetical protein
MATHLLAAVGDIHGRFERVERWLGELAQAHGRAPTLALGLGDLETFARADDPTRKASKRHGAAEFGPYARGERRLPCPLYFLSGNNEDFAALAPLAGGGELAPGVHYLGRAGLRELAGVRVGFLSGIHAPRSFTAPLEPPRGRESSKRWGYFREPEVAELSRAGAVELLLAHDWPRGAAAGAGPSWLGNPVVRALVDRLRPPWLLCGHQHQTQAITLGRTRLACLDEADQPGGALLWLEASDGRITRVGWGIDAKAAWEEGQPWDRTRLPAGSVGGGA